MGPAASISALIPSIPYNGSVELKCIVSDNIMGPKYTRIPSIVYCSSSGTQTPHLYECVKLYIDHVKRVHENTQAVHVLAITDARPDKKPWSDQPLYGEIKNSLRKLGKTVKAHHYELFNEGHLDVKKMDNLLVHLNEPAKILVVYGGNTWRVASGFAQLPGLRDAIVHKINSGEMMYVSFSAGSVLAGISVMLARDDVEPVKQELHKGHAVGIDGLGLVPCAIRPHAQSETSKEAGRKFEKDVIAGKVKFGNGQRVSSSVVKYVEDGQAGLYICGKWILLPPAAGEIPESFPDNHDGAIFLDGVGPYAGFYKRHPYRTLNLRPVYVCAATDCFIGFDGSEWHITSLQHYGEIVQKQGHFGSFDHSTNGAVAFRKSTWSKYVARVPNAVSLEGNGRFAGVYKVREHIVLNGEPIYVCAATGSFVGFSGSEWHITSLDYLDEITRKQGAFGSFDHSTNGSNGFHESTWSQYKVVGHFI